MESIKAYLNIASALSAFAAAAMWYKSAAVKVAPPEEDEPDENGIYPARIVVNGGDLASTIAEQARWGKYGAAAAGVAAFLQGLALLLPGSVA